MSVNTEVSGTLYRNIRLSASGPVVFAFGVNPLAAAWFFWYMVLNQTDHSWLPRRLQILVSILYLILSSTIVPMAASNYEKARLKKLGYEQRRSTRGIIDLSLNVGVCLGFGYWMQRQQDDERIESWLVLLTTLNALSAWVGLTLLYMGDIWWFTAHVR
jgi:hypothetical protein